MADAKRAFVFDTNFIIQNKNLKEVIENLNKNNYSVYVTQVAIDERIAQECVKQKCKYEKLATLSNETKEFATITIDKKYEDIEALYKTGMLKKYVDHFGKNIIPYSQDSEMFAKILQRAFMKIPPFITSGTDKGFKDSLMWLSILDYFKVNGENEIVFVSSDNGFKENTSTLCKEFAEVTGKTIAIKDNSYYKELLEKDTVTATKDISEQLPDFSKIREDIETVIDSLRWNVTEDYFGNENWESTFVLQKEVDSSYMKVVFTGLKTVVKEHIFEQKIPAFRVLDLDGRVAEDNGISMKNIEAALQLYEDISRKHPNYIEQFYTAAAAIINRSYRAPTNTFEDLDEDLPF